MIQLYWKRLKKHLWRRKFIKTIDTLKKDFREGVHYNPMKKEFTFTWTDSFEQECRSKPK